MEILGLFLSILVLAIFSGVEIVFTSGRFMNYKANDYNASTIKIAQKYTQAPNNMLIACLSVKLLALCVIAYFVFTRTHDLITYWSDFSLIEKLASIILIVSSVFLSLLLEYLPKSLSRFYTEQIVPAFSFFVLHIFNLLYYPSRLIQSTSSFFLRSAHITTTNVKIEYTALDLEKLISEHQQSNNTDEEVQVDTELFENVLFLKNLKVRECMVPRNEISSIEINGTIEQLKEVIISTYHSRILVYKDNIDNVIGYVHHFDLHKHPGTISDILIPIKVVPETMSGQILMNALIAENKSIAWVVNEYGGTAGVVTLEDILEEIFGEIDDEYDNKEFVENQLSKNEFILSGRLEIDRINEEYELNIPEGDYETLSGMIVNDIGRIPKENEVIFIQNFQFKILNVSETKIETVKLTVEDSTNNLQ